MTLATTTFGAGTDIVLLAGWLAKRSLWLDWAINTFAGYRVTLIDLPGQGDSPSLGLVSLEESCLAWQSAILDAMPEKAILVGWSLGGLLAQTIALSHPERVSHLILLASSPCFVQKTDWIHGLNPTHFARYPIELEKNPDALFKSFLMLTALGDTKPKLRFKQLTQALLPITSDIPSLAQGLTLLNQLDLRNQLQHLIQPTLWLLGDQDAIVPHSLAVSLAELHPSAQIKTIQDCGHLPFLSAETATQRTIQDFLHDISRLDQRLP